MRTITKLLAYGILFIPIYMKSQDIHFSQFQMSPLILNPANTGNFNGDQRGILNYRDQWRTIAKPYQTYSFSFDSQIPFKKGSKDYMAGGIVFYRDKAGDSELGSTIINLSVGYHLKMNKKNYLSGGLQGGYIQRSMNFSNLHWDSQYDGSGYNASYPINENVDLNKVSYGVFGAGILWKYYSRTTNITSNNAFNANAGVAVYNINQPKGSFVDVKSDKFYSRIVSHASTSIGIKNTNLSVQPGGVIILQGTMKEIMLGSMFRYILQEESKYTQNIKGSALSIGGYYRFRDAIIISSILELGKIYIGLSYDINVSSLAKASNSFGGFEISISFINPNPFIYDRTKSSAKFI